jgi:glycosyltransferase involved in cell wall biosynthesis
MSARDVVELEGDEIANAACRRGNSSVTGPGGRPQALVPRVAVLLPVRNGAETLASALGSLFGQSFRDFRIIAVDDASSDATPEILSLAASGESGVLAASGRRPHPCARGPVLEWIRLDRPAGIAGALEAAARLVRAEEFLARQDADDRSAPDRLAVQLKFLDEHPEIDVLATGVRPVAGSTDGWKRYEAWLSESRTPEEVALNLWIESPLPHPTVMMRRTAYDRAGGYRQVPWPEDYDLWLRMLRRGIRMAKLRDVLYEWTDHPGRASRNLPQYTLESFLRCRAHHLARYLEERAPGRAVVIWGAGRDGRRAARALMAEGVRIEAFLDIDPAKIGRRAYDRPVLDAEAWVRGSDPARLSDSVRGSDSARAALPSGGPGPERPAPLVLAAVGTAGARDLIRGRLRAQGFVEGRDFLCLA